MKTYIAASFERRVEARNLHDGNTISTWYFDDIKYDPTSSQRAYRDALQIERCDVLIFLMGDEGGCNRFWELGYAMGLGKEIVLIGEYDRCIFERLSYLRRYDNVDSYLQSKK